MLKALQRLVADRKGGTAIEYGLIASVVVITIIGSIMQLSNTTSGMWGNINNRMAQARSGQ